MTTKKIEAIILSGKSYGEADRILTAYTKTDGKIKILAKGSRKIKSKMASHIEPFSVGEYYLIQGKTFYILSGAETIENNHGLTQDIELYKDASYVCEILQLATEDNEEGKKLYETTKDVLSLLSSLEPAKRKILLRYFEYVILSENGYASDYEKCKKCGKALEKENSYAGDYEGVYCNTCKGEGNRISLETLKVLRLFSKRGIDTVMKIKNIEDLNEPLSSVITNYLYDIIPRPPRSHHL